MQTYTHRHDSHMRNSISVLYSNSIQKTALSDTLKGDAITFIFISFNSIFDYM